MGDRVILLCCANRNFNFLEPVDDFARFVFASEPVYSDFDFKCGFHMLHLVFERVSCGLLA